MGVWQTVPHIFADTWSLMKNTAPANADRKMQARAYNFALIFMAMAAVPFAFLHRPLFLVVAFTIIGSLFIPFLTATLLYLNNRIPWPSLISQNKIATNLILSIVLLFFLALGTRKSIEFSEDVTPFERLCVTPAFGLITSRMAGAKSVGDWP